MITAIILMIVSFPFALKFPSSKIGRRLIMAVKAKTGKRRARPLDCEACLSFWTTLALTVIFLPIWKAVIAAGVVFFAMAKYQAYKIKNL